jgi:hypothetical protein
MNPISEADWKWLRELQPIALERFCRRVLEEIDDIVVDVKRTNHERYLAVFELVRERDRELADAFDDLRRSDAFFHLAQIQLRELLTDEEMAGFSADAQAIVARFHESWQNS